MWTGEGAGCRGLRGGAWVNNRSASLCQQLLNPLHPQQTHPTPPHVWKNPIQLIRFFKMDQFLISRASDYGQYHCRWEDSCWTAVFIYRNVCFLLYADEETGNLLLRSLRHCSPWLVQAGVWPLHACVQQQQWHLQGHSKFTALWSCHLEDQLWIFIHIRAERWILIV